MTLSLHAVFNGGSVPLNPVPGWDRLPPLLSLLRGGVCPSVPPCPYRVPCGRHPSCPPVPPFIRGDRGTGWLDELKRNLFGGATPGRLSKLMSFSSASTDSNRRNDMAQTHAQPLRVCGLDQLPDHIATHFDIRAGSMKRFLSLSEVARSVNIALPRAQKLARAGVLRPDGTVGKTYIFDPDRLPELRASLAMAAARVEAPLFVGGES